MKTCWYAVLIATVVTHSERRLVAAEANSDIVIYGATSGGIVAAIQAKRMGKSVVLIEPSEHLGGMTTSGLGWTDIGRKEAIGGIAREFYHRIWKYYMDDSVWIVESRNAYNQKNEWYDAADDTMWTFEPHVASQIFEQMLAEAGVSAIKSERLDRVDGVRMESGCIVRIEMESGREFEAKAFIDATYEGDLMAAAGVNYDVGREANSVYGESINGVQPKLTDSHNFIVDVDPYLIPGDPSSGLLPGVHSTHLKSDGSGDERVQAYCFRICTTDVPGNRKPWPKPADYHESRYELMFRNLEAGDQRVPWRPMPMPNRKTDTNNMHAFSIDYIGGSDKYPEATYDEREKIVADHKSYQQGFLWTMANHPRVPLELRRTFNEHGLAKDEFVETDNWPPQLYVREARRMIGDHVMTEQHCRGSKIVSDSIGMGSLSMDSHNCQRYVFGNGFVRNEGDIQNGGFEPYPISYRSIVPKKSECTNLFVPVALSASHIAYGSIRMEPVFMILGQSAATAAAQAIDANVAVQDLDYAALADRLRDDKQRLTWPHQKRSSISTTE